MKENNCTPQQEKFHIIVDLVVITAKFPSNDTLLSLKRRKILKDVVLDILIERPDSHNYPYKDELITIELPMTRGLPYQGLPVV